ncbi:MAG: hypothetical protein ACOH2G_08080 [Ewingella sp.]
MAQHASRVKTVVVYHSGYGERVAMAADSFGLENLNVVKNLPVGKSPDRHDGVQEILNGGSDEI